MAEVLLWLLVNLPGGRGYNSAQPAVTIARFANGQECERVRKIIAQDRDGLMCVQARVVP